MSGLYERLKRGQALRQSSLGPRPLDVPQEDIPTFVPLAQTFVITNDGWVDRYSGSSAQNGYSTAPTYPPSGMQTVAPTISETIVVGKSYLYNSATSHTYWVCVGLMSFDTSSLPDTALVTGAVLRLHGLKDNNDQLRSLTLEWASWTPPRGVVADWTASVGTNAHAGFPLSSLPSPTASWFEIPLQNAAANVSKTGSTYLKAHISGGAPGVYGVTGGSNRATFKGRDYQGGSPGRTDLAPRLVVSYA